MSWECSHDPGVQPELVPWLGGQATAVFGPFKLRMVLDGFCSWMCHLEQLQICYLQSYQDGEGIVLCLVLRNLIQPDSSFLKLNVLFVEKQTTS